VDTQLRLAHGEQGEGAVLVETARRARAAIRISRGDIAGARADLALAERLIKAMGPAGAQEMVGLERVRAMLPKP